MNLLEIKNLSKHYAKHTALNKVSMAVPKGSIYGLLGPNGAGKTSLIRVINQITGADEGEILFAGETLEPDHIRKMGYLPEERGLYKKMKVGEQLLYLAQLRGLSKSEIRPRLKKWLVDFEMQDWWEKKITDLSKGMQQKVQFIATVLHEPQLIILDEPFTGFDPINTQLIIDKIMELKAQGSTIIFSTHRMESVEQLCDHICLINKSEKILEGKKLDIKHQYRKQEYTLRTQEELNLTDFPVEILSSEQTELSDYQSVIKLSQEVSSNELLQEVLKNHHVIGFEEKLPSIHDIFIELVENAKN